ncbi:protein YhfH [Paenibacillus vulneris]|uniref:Protein YhfH n=2 Tax=Paenibacillus vulneris TaxID=1133364 RepID=A0ABW3UXM8_9BACL
MNPLELYAVKRCCRCGIELEEQADCYKTTCDECEGNTFYPPVSAEGQDREMDARHEHH